MARAYSRLFPALLIALMIPGAALADQIDGYWCFNDGRSLSIQGARIVTPGGNELRGKYDRHGFEYVVPQGEPGAGDRVTMAQLNDNVIHLWRRPGGTDEPQIWHRCDQKTS